MRGAKHIRSFRSIAQALCLGFAVLLAIAACQRSDEPPLPISRPVKRSAPSVQPGEAPAPTADPWVRHQLGELRDQALKWTPRVASLQQLTFADQRLYTTLASEVIVLDPTGKRETQRFAVQGRHLLVPLADASVLGVGATNTFVIRPDAKQPENQRNVLLLPQEVLFGNAGILGQFDALDTNTGRWSSYSFNSKPGVSSVWLPDRTYETPELERGLCAELIDGSYACQASERWWQMYTRSRPKLIGKCTKGAQVWRVLPGSRTDQAWLARNDGTLEKWWLVEPPKRLSVIDLPWTPLDIAVRGEHIAVIRISQNRAQAKTLSLVVLDSEGHQHFEQSLMAPTDNEANAAEADIREAELVIHPTQPWIGLRTSRGTRVIDMNTGATLVQVQ
jgi:hypothetical protein